MFTIFTGVLDGDLYLPYDDWGMEEPPDRYYLTNSLDYHRKVEITIVHETNKAYLVKDSIGEYWIPKKLLIQEQYQWRNFKPKYLKTGVDEF